MQVDAIKEIPLCLEKNKKIEEFNPKINEKTRNELYCKWSDALSRSKKWVME